MTTRLPTFLFALIILPITGCEKSAPPLNGNNELIELVPKRVPPMPEHCAWNASEPPGLEMAAWLDPEFPIVWCAVRNPGTMDVRYCDHYLGNLGCIKVFARPKGKTEWKPIPGRKDRMLCHEGLGPTRRDYRTIGGGKVLPPPRRYWPRPLPPGAPFTISVGLDGFSWPQEWSGEGELFVEQARVGANTTKFDGVLRSNAIVADLGSLRKTRDEKAVEAYTEIIRRDPRNAAAYCHRGMVRKAADDLTEAIRIDPKFAEAYYERALVYACNWNQKDTRNLDKAISDVSEAIRLKPDYFDAYRFRAYLYADRKRFDDAIADYTKCIQGDPKNALTSYSSRAYVYRCESRFDDAIADYTDCIRLGSVNDYTSSAYRQRATCYEKKGDTANAEKDKAAAEKLEDDGI
jgi:Tfp pilus assembly protein PilF